jgi:hypothetical protein
MPEQNLAQDPPQNPSSPNDPAADITPTQSEPVEAYEPPELVKFERLEKLIVSGE